MTSDQIFGRLTRTALGTARHYWRTIILSFVGIALATGSAAADPKPFIKQGPLCGTPENVHFCARLASSSPTANNRVDLAPYAVKFPSSGVALVSWNGSVYCDGAGRRSDGASAASFHEYFINLSIKDDDSPLQYNDLGSVTIGERVDSAIQGPSSSSFRMKDDHIVIYPVALTRLYKINKKAKKEYKLSIFPEFRIGSVSCNVNGGAITVQFTPD